MFDQILVPLDGSSTAQTALPAALSLAMAFNSTVELIHVLCPETGDTATQIDPLQWHMRKVEIEAYLSSVRQVISSYNLKTKQTVLEGSVAERIISHAADKDSSLIVMSSHGDGGASSWNISSVAQKIVARANRSILLIRAFQQPPVTQDEIEPLPLKRLLVPLDGSRRAESILPIASKLAAAHGATVWLVHVATLASLTLPFQTHQEDLSLEQAGAQYREAAMNYLQQLQLQLECATESVVIQGDTVVGALNQFVQQESIDLMLLCAHGRTDSHQPYGTGTTSIIFQGNASLFVFQDLLPDEIEPTQAEVASSQHGHPASGRAKPHAQPAFWTH